MSRSNGFPAIPDNETARASTVGETICESVKPAEPAKEAVCHFEREGGTSRRENKQAKMISFIVNPIR